MIFYNLYIIIYNRNELSKEVEKVKRIRKRNFLNRIDDAINDKIDEVKEKNNEKKLAKLEEKKEDKKIIKKDSNKKLNEKEHHIKNDKKNFKKEKDDSEVKIFDIEEEQLPKSKKSKKKVSEES